MANVIDYPGDCSRCGAKTEKIAFMDHGEAWLFWGCSQDVGHWPESIDENREFGIDWPVGSEEPITKEWLDANGFRIE